VRYATTQLARPHDPHPGHPRGLLYQEGFHLDLLAPRRDDPLVEDGEGRAVGAVPVYYERWNERVRGKPGMRITYWFLFDESVPGGPRSAADPFRHEGDWERTSVLLQHGQRADEYLPVSVRYFVHLHAEDIPWRKAEVVAGDGRPGPATHPVVYSARGKHTTYPPPGGRDVKVQVTEGGRLRKLVIPDETANCPACIPWRTWRKLRDVRLQPWYGYGGAWGSAGDDGSTTGSLGPSRFTKKLGGAADAAAATTPLPPTDLGASPGRQ